MFSELTDQAEMYNTKIEKPLVFFYGFCTFVVGQSPLTTLKAMIVATKLKSGSVFGNLCDKATQN